MRFRKTIIFALSIALLTTLIINVSVCKKVSLVCENTGSHKGYIEWVLVGKTDQWHQKSALENFLLKIGKDIEHNWVSYQGTEKNIFGESIGFSHGKPLLTIRLDVFNQYMNSLSDEEKQQVYGFLKKQDKEKILDLRQLMEEFQN